MAAVGSEEVARDPQVRALRARLKRAAQELDGLKKDLVSQLLQAHFHPADPVSAYEHIAQRAAHVPVRQRCPTLRVAPAAYYAWRHRRRHAQGLVEPAWQVAVGEAFAYHSQHYGTCRRRAVVLAQGHVVGRWRIRRVLHAHGLRAQQPRSFVPRTTNSDPAVRAAPNRLLDQPAPPPRIGSGWATARSCRARAAAGATWPGG